ncbi:MAG: flippase-like domain-containing protein [Deltaproteobacteria bacterium]|nr:flippase-like domain-containing protein [Deltaproteobacteria bacterium]
MKKNIAISLILGIALSAVTLYLAFRNVPFADLVHYLTSINYLWVIPSILLSIISFMLRALRWQIIMESVKKIGFWRLFHPMMIGFMVNCVLPGRVGEVARPAILKKNDNVPFTTGLATVVAERVFDVSLILGLFAAVFATVSIDPSLNMTFADHHLNKETLETISNGMVKICVVIIAGMFAVSIASTRKIINNVIMGIPSLFFFISSHARETLRERVFGHLVHAIENISTGFSLIRYPKKLTICFGLSFFIWVLQGFSYYVMSLGCPGIGLSFYELFAVMIIICFFIALPSVPGFWGLWEAGGVFALSLFGVSTRDAAGFTLANHAIQVFPVIIIGIVSAVITGINIWQISYGEK